MTFNFSYVAFDQVINNAPNMRYMSGGQFRVPIVFRGPNGAAGQLGATHSNSTEALYSNFPGLKVVAPSIPDDGKGLLKTAIRDDDPVVFLESELMYGMTDEVSENPDYTIPIGSARVAREGDDVTIVAHSKSYHVALDAAEQLSEKGYEAEVIDPRTIKPLDIETIVESVVKTNRLVVVDESTPFSSVAAEVTHQVQDRAFDYLDAPILRVTAPDTPAPYAPNLMDAYMPGAEETVDKCLRVLYAE
jgi:pyruvate dehydrogenase E1 component beta subunit